MFKVLTKGCEPTRGSKYSACVDLYAAEDVVIGAGETKLIGLGVAIDDRELFNLTNRLQRGGCIYSDFDDFKRSHYLQLMLHSSLGEKGLILPNGVRIIDFDYKYEIKMIIHNPISRKNTLNFIGSDGVENIRYKSTQIKKGDKIAQITLLEHKSYLFGIDTDKERDGGFGSTGK